MSELSILFLIDRVLEVVRSKDEILLDELQDDLDSMIIALQMTGE